MEYVYFYCGNTHCIPNEPNIYDHILTDYSVLEEIIPSTYLTKINITWNCPQCIEHMYNCINKLKSRYFLPNYNTIEYLRSTMWLVPAHVCLVTNYNFILNNGYYSIENLSHRVYISKLIRVLMKVD